MEGTIKKSIRSGREKVLVGGGGEGIGGKGEKKLLKCAILYDNRGYPSGSSENDITLMVRWQDWIVCYCSCCIKVVFIDFQRYC